MIDYLKKRIESFRPKYKRAYTQLYDRMNRNLTMKDYVQSMAHYCKLQEDYIEELETKLKAKDSE